MRRSTIFALALLAFAGQAAPDTYVRGYCRKDGTCVEGHFRAQPDQYRYNNRQSETRGGRKRDEFSSRGGATNRSNSAYGIYDNDGDGVDNFWDAAPENRRYR